MWVVYTTIFSNGDIENWYYGCWSDRDQANKCALRLNYDDTSVFHCVCKAEEAKNLNINNLPNYIG